MQLSDSVLQRYVEKYELLPAEKLAEARAEAASASKTQPSLQSVLVNRGFVSEEDLLKIYAKETGVAFVDLESLSPEPGVVTRIPEELAVEKSVMALEERNGHLLVAMADPNDVSSFDKVQRLSPLLVQPVLA